MSGRKKKTIISVEDVKKLATEDELILYLYVATRSEKVAKEVVDYFVKTKADEGRIIFVGGPLSSGKTIVAAMVASTMEGRANVGCYLPYVEGRSDIPKDKFYSRSGVVYPAICFKTKKDIERMFSEHDVMIVDEIHLIPCRLQSFFMRELHQFRDRGGCALLASILYTSQRCKFVLVELISNIADKVYMFKATCQGCGSREAVIGQRLVNGRPTEMLDDEYMSPSEEVVYEPRCQECYALMK